MTKDVTCHLAELIGSKGEMPMMFERDKGTEKELARHRPDPGDPLDAQGVHVLQGAVGTLAVVEVEDDVVVVLKVLLNEVAEQLFPFLGHRGEPFIEIQ